MTGQRLPLQPFPGETIPSNWKLTVAVARQRDTLTIGYALLGDLAGLIVPVPAERPARRNNLWAT
jgi:hypothetical protein